MVNRTHNPTRYGKHKYVLKDSKGKVINRFISLYLAREHKKRLEKQGMEEYEIEYL